MISDKKNVEKRGIFTQANREAWNEAMPKHQAVKKEYWDEQFKKPGFSALNKTEARLWESIGIEGKDIVQLCCNNGVELLSLKNLGAKSCTGFDICDEAVKEANDRARLTGIRDCIFIRSNIYDIETAHLSELHQKFDVVYVTVGALIWMPDIDLFFKKASELVKPGGHIFIYEEHPFVMMFDDDLTFVDDKAEKKSADVKNSNVAVEGNGSEQSQTIKDNRLLVRYSYFKDDAWIDNTGIDYIGQTIYESKTMYVFTHTMSDIVMGLIKNDFDIKVFEEFDEDITNNMSYFEKTGLRLPVSFILIGGKDLLSHAAQQDQEDV